VSKCERGSPPVGRDLPPHPQRRSDGRLSWIGEFPALRLLTCFRRL
jgi:hypothetical protein